MAEHPLLGGIAQEATAEELLGLLDLIADRVGILTAVRNGDGTLRVSVSGGLLPTVTTVATITNLAQLGGVSAQPLVPSAQNVAAVLSNLNHLVVS